MILTYDVVDESGPNWETGHSVDADESHRRILEGID